MKSRYDIQFSPSRLECEKIQKLVQEATLNPAATNKEEMPYRLFTKVWNLFAIAATLSGITLLVVSYELYSAIDDFLRLKSQIFWSCLVLASSLILLYLVFKLEQYYLVKNQLKEQSVQQRLIRIKINRKYIDSIKAGTLVRIFWQHVEECYIKEEYLFIFGFDGEGTVIPARVLSIGEFKELYQFATEQIANHKSK